MVQHAAHMVRALTARGATSTVVVAAGCVSRTRFRSRLCSWVVLRAQRSIGRHVPTQTLRFPNAFSMCLSGEPFALAAVEGLEVVALVKILAHNSERVAAVHGHTLIIAGG